ncbi:hypothetical protein MHTCC0001_07260 [Flavobacteriaceae bacterium MHTCC 0001]
MVGTTGAGAGTILGLMQVLVGVGTTGAGIVGVGTDGTDGAGVGTILGLMLVLVGVGTIGVGMHGALHFITTTIMVIDLAIDLAIDITRTIIPEGAVVLYTVEDPLQTIR